MRIGNLPNVSFISQNRVVNAAVTARFRTENVEEQSNKKTKKGGDKNAVAFLTRCTAVVYSKTQGRLNLHRFYGRAQKSWDHWTSTIHKSFAASRRHEIQVKIPHQRSPYAINFEERSQEEIERQERSARGYAWRLAKNILMLKETDKATFFSPPNEWSLPAHPQ